MMLSVTDEELLYRCILCRSLSFNFSAINLNYHHIFRNLHAFIWCVEHISMLFHTLTSILLVILIIFSSYSPQEQRNNNNNANKNTTSSWTFQVVYSAIYLTKMCCLPLSTAHIEPDAAVFTTRPTLGRLRWIGRLDCMSCPEADSVSWSYSLLPQPNTSPLSATT